MSAHRAERGAYGALLVDLYQLTMAASYHAEGTHDVPATFSLYARELPAGWGYLVAAGLEDALEFLESFAFEEADLAYLESTGLFEGAFLDHLRGVRFRGDVRALPEGTLCFPDEPLLEVDAGLLEAQLAETMLLNEVYVQSLVAGKAARCVDVAGGRTLVDFALRRTHGPGAGMRVTRSSWLAGFDATSNVLAGKELGIPIAGTMAHSYVEAFDDEPAAFRAYARSFPDRAILLVDTYDTLAGVRRAAAVGRELAASGHRLAGVRLDSGDLSVLARESRELLDAAGLGDVTIFASGGLDEHAVARLVEAGAPIDGFGVGTRLAVFVEAPGLDMAYKLVAVDGRPVLKLSGSKATRPGAKQVWRVAADGRYALDVVGLASEDDREGAEPLLRQVMHRGRRVWRDSLGAARERCAAGRGRLAERHRRLAAEPYDVELTAKLLALSERTAAEARRRHDAP